VKVRIRAAIEAARQQWKLRDDPQWIPRAIPEIPDFVPVEESRQLPPAPSKWVRIDHRLMMYRAKAPYVQSGHSVLGAIEYDKKADLLKCHECGGWYARVGVHSHLTHNLPACEYKRKHGLRNSSSLDCERLRKLAVKRMEELNERQGGPPVNADPEKRRMATEALKSARNARYTGELKNMRMTCQAQIIAKVQALAKDLRHTPTVTDLESVGLTPSQLFYSLNCANLSDAMRFLGLPPNPAGRPARHQGLTRASTLELLAQFVKLHEKFPTSADMRRGLVPQYSTIRRFFGRNWKSTLSNYIREREEEQTCKLISA